MNIIDFVKNAGEKIFKPGEARRESAIEKHLAKYGISGIKVEVDGDRATLTGTAADTATREKAVLIAGNIDGISNVEDRIQVLHATPAPVAAAPATTATQPASAASTNAEATGWASRTYTVKSGDSLSKIAKEMYGDASKYPQIFEANKPMLTDPDKIYPGQVLRVPPLQ
ncbi:peptidoglycan-binding protein LysM [Lysobacter sp. H21R4]|uniref:peptidoglycan-binding protein LysM n=1 Tax=Lysobacter sp. H21R4 TaxID=2781021 RepID=UPI0018891FEA|nr:peptidoglycan-binding protein LysM [Lysobacter sp. H21R4]QOY63721.1 peptidoglycan-binding protein LysM [Lysobacter sp. H21R4]